MSEWPRPSAPRRDRRTVSPKIVLALLFSTCAAVAYAIYWIVRTAR